MIFPLVAALAFTLATLLPCALVGLALLVLRRRSRRYWRSVLWAHAGLFVLHLFVTFPLALGLLGSRGLGTRPQEIGYAGPRLDAKGRWLPQNWDSLARERLAGKADVAPDILASAAARRHTVPSTDGVTLRVFRVEPIQEPPVAAAVLVHGLFRSSMELEPVARMLRDLGCECWVVEVRNHGESSRAPFTGGLRESDDVVAAVEYVRARPERAGTPVVVFGVSLGTIAVSLALPRLQGLAGVVLDAPMDDLLSAAHRMLSFDRAGDRRSFFQLAEPWRSATIAALGMWSGFRVADVVPADVLATLPVDLPVLVVGAGDDDRAPPATVRQLFARLPMPEGKKELWIRDGSKHGHVFVDAPEDYAAALARLLARLRRP